ncbi:Auxin response factor 17 [Apostasia shenzhenica]|uniref:Auxin response factor n=1 Tax=Apostasia shenzhenica TaxID=1088818 RepID=A0A2H9ZXF9_9ASPA|nr:Auxin response factor 17 [Apostasia shenzhenica]
MPSTLTPKLMASSRSLRQLDAGVWKACAGGSTRLPKVGSLVYYFPEGHREHGSSLPDFSSILRSSSFFLCRVNSVFLSAHSSSDEVYAKISLDPRVPNAPAVPASSPPSLDLEEVATEGSGIISFSKVLTPSDANNGGGFSVPRFCADSIFPKLDFTADPPVQNISVIDVHGNSWEFRHIYRGTPRRHLLTTGWSKFVNSKKLVAGDSVVFMRNLTGQIFLGIRRTSRTSGGAINFPTLPEFKLKPEEGVSGEGFSRSNRGKVSSESIVEAVRDAELGRPFEVLYYPKIGWPEFVVAKEMVDAAMTVPWGSGMRIKMAVETEDFSRTTWFQGTVAFAANPENDRWALSPWRMLQVNWDEPEVLQNLKTVNPWQVQVLSPNQPYPVAKKPRLLDGVDLPIEGHGGAESSTGCGSAEMGFLSPSLCNLIGSPFGRQGARHFTLSNFVPTSTNQVFSNIISGIDIKNPHISISEIKTPPNEGSVEHCGAGIFSSGACNGKRSAKGTIQLFGQIIQIEPMTESKVTNDFSAAFSHKQLLGSHLRLSVVGACE